MQIRVHPAISDQAARERLRELIVERGYEMTEVSDIIRRAAGYIGRYIREGKPRRLDPADRRVLANYFGVEECELGVGARPPREPFAAWLLGQGGRGDRIGDLAIAARLDRRIPREGRPEEVRDRMLRSCGGAAEMREIRRLVDKAERAWRAT